MKVVACILIGYIIGCINPSFIIGKIKGFDIRKRGSGNAGASNALITMGKTIGILSAIFDIIKAIIAIKISQLLFPDFIYALPICGLSCIVGHIFPFYMRFKGGKGLACLGGLIISIDLRYFFILLAIEIIIVLVSDYICFVPITASFTLPFAYFYFYRNIIGAAILILAFIIIFTKHLENLKRIKEKTEVHFSYLWKKEERERAKKLDILK